MKIFNSKNLVELHSRLNDFAIHHQNKGGQEAIRIIKQIHSLDMVGPRDGSKEGVLRSQGYDEAMKSVMVQLQKRFVL